jgi:DNA (cytosine-5)-methyltransferase 1
MTKYSCDKCKKGFSQKSHFESHQKRKKPCVDNIGTNSKVENKMISKEKDTMHSNMVPHNNNIKFIDLFSGIGSFHYSFKKLGWECVMACDINKSARDTYEHNYKMKPLGDICDIDPKSIPQYDILCAGFPCQPFSIAGKHKGFADERGSMFSQVMKFVKHSKPKIIILENVRALLTHDSGKSFDKIKTDITEQGYNVTHKILTCSDYGIPQMRKRLFIIGIKNTINVKTGIANLLDLKKYEKTNTLTKYLNKNFEKNIAYTIRCGGKHSPIKDKHNWDGYIVDKKEYRLMIDDALKLQGFIDKDFKLVGSSNEQWNMLGNTIPTIFTEIIGKQINDLIF